MSTVSDAARAAIDEFRRREQRQPPRLPGADDHDGWRELQAFVEDAMTPRIEAALAAHDVDVEPADIADMPALRLRPRVARPRRLPLVFLHGGGYTSYSARSALPGTLALATALQREVLVPDYTLAPASRVAQTVPAVSGALRAIMAERGPFHLAGDSAGGGLAVAATLAMIRAGGPRPETVTVFSPWTDLAGNGDSHRDPDINDPLLRWDGMLDRCAAAYAGDDPSHPDASPVNADFSGGFPDTLVICGSREILLSDSQRLHQRLRGAGQRSQLQVFDGLYHAFPVVTPDIPEAAQTRQRMRNFIQHGA
ncbi:alpha/beta hydrolase [Marinihelvus fidelis]|uniref:Alpha/beta hydrolase n=1 Tax=Marinihelvus fidelis TaxID=2613842 RepID=A0A5N0T7A0_9GAMM|nr:alpha/beta hydrolase [Marinihelvus fidelis]KAA9129696.1 alpha/beta hydrolase [Marinihelvus fidelis]